MEEFEVYFRDLTKEAQERLLKFYNIKDVNKETNWDIMCLFILYNCDGE